MNKAILFWEVGDIPEEYQFFVDDVDWAALLPVGMQVLPIWFDTIGVEIFYRYTPDFRIVATCCHA